MKLRIKLLLALTLGVSFMTGCAQVGLEGGGAASPETIHIISREDGSGTRGAFVEIVDILETDGAGNKNDATYEEAIIQNGTDAVMTTVSGDKNAIGYISLGSLNDTVKALKIEGVQATSENLQAGTYQISRNFNIAYKEDISPLAEDFLLFILSLEGQSTVAEEGYVEISKDFASYNKSGQVGILTVAGSTSVSPVMEKLAEQYESFHPDVSIEIQSTGSSAGIQAVLEGNADIGMASRELKDSEKEGLNHKAIAIDGIAVILNDQNPLESLTLTQVKSIYTGQITTWSDIQ